MKIIINGLLKSDPSTTRTQSEITMSLFGQAYTNITTIRLDSSVFVSCQNCESQHGNIIVDCFCVKTMEKALIFTTQRTLFYYIIHHQIHTLHY